MLPMTDLLKHAAALMEFLDDRGVKAPDACVIMSIGMGRLLRHSKQRKEFIANLEFAWDAMDAAMAAKTGEQHAGRSSTDIAH